MPLPKEKIVRLSEVFNLLPPSLPRKRQIKVKIRSSIFETAREDAVLHVMGELDNLRFYTPRHQKGWLSLLFSGTDIYCTAGVLRACAKATGTAQHLERAIESAHDHTDKLDKDILTVYPKYIAFNG